MGTSAIRPYELHRDLLLPEPDLPDPVELIAQGRSIARRVTVGDCAFLRDRGVSSEAEWKQQCMTDGTLTVHSQIGYREPAKTRRAWREIWEKAGERGGRVDRYGICLDWSMGLPMAERCRGQRGTGLLLEHSEEFAALTDGAPVAPHFGDFVLGMPAAVENTVAALGAGSTAIGNLGQYFTFRLPGRDDDIGDTAATIRAIALIAAQPVPVMIHSNLDDGFAALFTDLACSLGAVLIERYVVDELLDGSISHCYGHSFSEPWKRLVFQLALTRIQRSPGTMVYGNTVMYRGDGNDNYAALANYLGVDIAAQRHSPSGHGINPVPITEARRIPDIDEVVDAAVFAARMIEQAEDNAALIDMAHAERSARELVVSAQQFFDSVVAGLGEAGIDIRDPFEMLLSLRRLGARRLEELFGPGRMDPGVRRGRVPVLAASTIARLEQNAERIVEQVAMPDRYAIREAGLTVCIATSDVHEYGKILLEETLDRLGVHVVDAGVHADPDAIALLITERNVDCIAISTYNGVALDYVESLGSALSGRGLDVPILIGGRTNQIPRDSAASLPVDVSVELRDAGAVVCTSMRDMIAPLLQITNQR